MSDNETIIHLIGPRPLVCEIGVRSGTSSQKFLGRGCFVYLVDPWEDYDGYLEKNYNYPKEYQDTLDVLKNYPDQYKIIRKKSDDAVNDVPENLDLVFIDGNHLYEYVARDIRNYWPKIKSGGWLTGDDYSDIPDTPEEKSYQQVKTAVDEFVASDPTLSLGVFGRCWAIRKP